MKHLLNEIVSFWMLSIVICACSDITKVDYALHLAGSNREEMQKVIEHCQMVDSLNLKAAYYLLENMEGHTFFWSVDIVDFRKKVCSSDLILDKKQVNDMWNSSYRKNAILHLKDLEIIKADFLIGNIDMAFKAWKEVPWRQEISFDDFCQYVLPYRFDKELLADGWRDSLFNRYYPYVKNVSSAKEAFEIIYEVAASQFFSSSSEFPFVLDPVAMLHQKDFSCMQRTILIGSIMRSLCIPVSIDCVNYWANYSSNGHSWIALITKDGTYSIYEEEREAKRFNMIDATRFKMDYQIEDDYPFDCGFQKRFAKIWRITYGRNDNRDIPEIQSLSNPFLIDASAEYGLFGRVDVQTESKEKFIYLCTFLTGKNFVPICYAQVIDGIAHFDNLGDSVLYLLMEMKSHKILPVGHPFVLIEGKARYLKPNHNVISSIEILRKYPLTGKFINDWAGMVGNCLEASNDSIFSEKELVCTIKRTPVFFNRFFVNDERQFKFVRYISNHTAPLAEIKIYGIDGEINLKTSLSTIGNVEKTIDNDTESRANAEIGYAGYQLLEPQKIVSIELFPKNDGNFISPNHEYELFYYNDGWTSLGKQVSTGYSLRYDNVPDGALLLLRDKSKGNEERPFLYKDGKQEWW